MDAGVTGVVVAVDKRPRTCGGHELAQLRAVGLPRRIIELVTGVTTEGAQLMVLLQSWGQSIRIGPHGHFLR